MAHEPPEQDKDTGPANALWGGRFSGGAADIMAHINASIDFDRRLYRQDIAGSRAHCNMLVAQGVIDSLTLDRAQRAQLRTHERLDVILTRLGLISEADLAAARASGHGS